MNSRDTVKEYHHSRSLHLIHAVHATHLQSLVINSASTISSTGFACKKLTRPKKICIDDIPTDSESGPANDHLLRSCHSCRIAGSLTVLNVVVATLISLTPTPAISMVHCTGGLALPGSKLTIQPQ